MATALYKNTTKTFVQSYIELLRATGANYQLIKNSTLNQKLGIQHISNWPPAGISPAEFPRIQYLAIGSGGHYYNLSAGNTQGTIKQYMHDPIHCAMFNQIPWAARPIDDDFGQPLRDKYRLREVRNINGEEYAIYWLRRIDLDSAVPELNVVRIENGVEVESYPYDPETYEGQQLNPVPISLDNINENVVDGLHLMVKSSVGLNLDSTDISEILNAYTTVNPGAGVDEAVISEVGIVWGFDMNVNTPEGTIKEAGAAQIINHINTHISLQFINNNINLSYGLADGMPTNLDE